MPDTLAPVSPSEAGASALPSRIQVPPAPPLRILMLATFRAVLDVVTALALVGCMVACTAVGWVVRGHLEGWGRDEREPGRRVG